MKTLLVVTLPFAFAGCSLSSLYPPMGATFGAAGGAVATGGNPVGAGVGAVSGYSLGKAAQVGAENKDLQETVELYEKGDVEALVQKRLEEEAGEGGLFGDALAGVKDFMKLCLIGLVLWNVVPLLVTWLSHSKTNKKLKEQNGISEKDT